MKKSIAILIIIYLILLVLPTTALANGPAPARSFTIYIKNAPEGSYGLDFLLPKEFLAKDGCLSENSELLNDIGLTPDCELAKIDSDGYVSYLAHYSNAIFNCHLEESQSTEDTLAVDGFADEYNDGGFDYIAYSLPGLKLALFDEEGSILAISDRFQIAKRPIDNFMGSLTYDAATGEVIPDIRTSQFAVILLLLLVIFICGLTIGIEVLVGLCFKIKPLYKVVLVTGCSNLVMNILLLICCNFISHPLPYLPCVIVGEIVAIVAEYLIYLALYKGTKRSRLLVFTLTANLISAVVVFALFNWIS